MSEGTDEVADLQIRVAGESDIFELVAENVWIPGEYKCRLSVMTKGERLHDNEGQKNVGEHVVL